MDHSVYSNFVQKTRRFQILDFRVRGHSRSLKVVLFNRLLSYSNCDHKTKAATHRYSRLLQ